jgi:hypothetical protein
MKGRWNANAHCAANGTQQKKNQHRNCLYAKNVTEKTKTWETNLTNIMANLTNGELNKENKLESSEQLRKTLAINVTEEDYNKGLRRGFLAGVFFMGTITLGLLALWVLSHL